MKKLGCFFVLILIINAISAQTAGFSAYELEPHKQNLHLKSANDFYHDDYDVHFYFLDINVENTSTEISGKVEIHAKVTTTQLDTFFFEIKDFLTVDSVAVNGIPHNCIQQNNVGKIPLIASLGQNGIVTTEIFYQGLPITTGFFSGISHDTVPFWNNLVTWTLSEPFNADDWWPCKQDLKDKADSAWIFITTDSSNKAGSNGLLTNITDLNNGKFRYEWKTHYPIVYYLISVAVSDYDEYSVYAKPANYGGDSILIQNYIYNDGLYLNLYQSDIDKTVDLIELFSNVYGLYPFAEEKYGHCLAPMGGGMEHQTMTTQANFGFYLTCHELAHQWFGDNVTCSSWQDIWINEGFATYSEIICAENLLGQAAAEQRIVDKQNSVMSQPGGSVYVPAYELSNVWRIFDGRLSYSKGACILHMLRFEMNNDTTFFNTLKTFQNIYKDSVASGEDFKAVAESVSGMNLTTFFDQWYYGEGFPQFDVLWYQEQDSLYISSYQSTSTTTTTLFEMSFELLLSFSGGGDTTIRLFQNDTANYHKIILTNRQVVGIAMDPNNWNLDSTANISVDLSEINKEMHFSLYPNPAEKYIQLQLAREQKEELSLYIIDIMGRIVLQDRAFSATKKIDVSFLKQGVYSVILENEKGFRSTKRFVKL